MGNVRSFDKHRHSMTVEGSPSASAGIVRSANTMIDIPNRVKWAQVSPEQGRARGGCDQIGW